MKKFILCFIALLMVLGTLPQSVVAAETTQLEQELDAYLKEISTVRGFEVTKDHIEMSLWVSNLSLEDLHTAAELRNVLGEVIHEDLSNLDSIYSAYGLDKDSLFTLLAENGEDIKDYVFVKDLDYIVKYYTDLTTFQREPDFDQKLADYIAKVSEIRGLTVTKEDIEKELSDFGLKFEDFEKVEDIEAALGEVIKADLSNLDTVYDTYKIDYENLAALIEGNGESLDDFIFTYDVLFFVGNHTINHLTPSDESTQDELIPEEESLKELLPELSEFGITEEELNQLYAYYITWEDYYTSPDFSQKLEYVENPMNAFDDIKSIEDLSDDQIKEITDIFNDYLSIYKIRLTFSQVNNGKETAVTIKDFIKSKIQKETDLKISVYSINSKLLADIIIPKKYIAEFYDDFEAAMEESADVADTIIKKQEKRPTPNNTGFSTVKGAKLPTTASTYIQNALIGSILLCAGICLYKKVRNERVGFTKK